ncbi:MAG TPA: signal peptidase I, partial [Thermodesulfovibrionales bacterium]|nr:signal peptidase I [Thermodesulfovibrionales bacterium]
MKKNKKEIFWEYVKAIVTALLLALFIRAYFIQAFKIPSGSMLTTLLIGDHILVNKFIYGTKLPFSDKRILRLRKPAKGDIIVFKYPEDPTRDFIKRVIGVEGDVIESRDKVLFVNGLKVTEPYAQHVDSDIMPRGPDCRYEPGILTGPNSQYCRDSFGPLTVPK